MDRPGLLGVSGCCALQRATQHWESRERPERAIEAAIIIRADTLEDAAAELEDMANRIRTGELTEGRGGGRHVTFAWCATAHNAKQI